MRGDERARCCDVCHKTVRNISLLTDEEREALLRTNDGDLCVAYYTHLNGELATVETLQQRSAWKIVQAGVAGLAAGAWLVTAGCATRPKVTPEAQAPQVQNHKTNDDVVFMTLGFVCAPEKPSPHGVAK